MRFNDDVEPWRAGGNNSRAGQQVIRYGPRFQDEAIRQSNLASMRYYAENIGLLMNSIEKFNACAIPDEKQNLLEKICAKNALHFKGYGKVPNENAAHIHFPRKWKTTTAEHAVRISENQLVLKKLVCEETKEYKTLKVFPISKITLELHGENKEDWQKSVLEVHAIMPDDERITNWRKIFLGW